jgi:hypothetical protein
MTRGRLTAHLMEALRECVILQNLVSARPSVSAASSQASSALRMQRRRTKPLRGGPTAPCLWGLNRPSPGLGTRQEGSLASGSDPRGDVGGGAMVSTRVALQGIPTPPVQGGRSRISIGHHGNTGRDVTSSSGFMSYQR